MKANGSSTRNTVLLVLKCVLLLAVAMFLGRVAWELDVTDFSPSMAVTPLQCPYPGSSGEKTLGKPFRFIAFGDFGANTLYQTMLAQQMEALYKREPYDTALLLGDNIYPVGDITKLAKSHFEKPYRYLIDHKLQFITCFGNHDLADGHKAEQLAYFKMPNDYYVISKGVIDVFVLNTVSFPEDQPQREWLDAALGKSHARWKIVMGHHPLYSSGRHGGKSFIRRQLLPILKKHQVDLYLSGHDHLYERFKPEGSLHFTVSGGGGAFLYNFRKRILPNSLVHLRTHHFLSFEIAGNRIYMKAINKWGQVIDCESWEKAESAGEPESKKAG